MRKKAYSVSKEFPKTFIGKQIVFRKNGKQINLCHFIVMIAIIW